MKKVVTFLLFSMFISTAMAKEQYVIDVLWVTLRSGVGDEFQVLQTLKSGAKVEVLEINEEEGYSFVKTSAGREGWIKSRYLTETPVAILQVNQLQKENKKLKEEITSLKQNGSQAKSVVKEATKERRRLESKAQKLQAELDRMKSMSARPMELAKDNKKLQDENSSMQKELVELRNVAGINTSNKSRDWFIAGAGVLVIGLVIGLILPSIRWRKKNSW